MPWDEEHGEDYVGGVEDLEALLQQIQQQSPQKGLGAFLGGEREGTRVDDSAPRVPISIINEIAAIQKQMDKDDPNRHALEAILEKSIRFLGETQRDRFKNFDKAVRTAHFTDDSALNKTSLMKKLGFE